MNFLKKQEEKTSCNNSGSSSCTRTFIATTTEGAPITAEKLNLLSQLAADAAISTAAAASGPDFAATAVN